MQSNKEAISGSTSLHIPGVFKMQTRLADSALPATDSTTARCIKLPENDLMHSNVPLPRVSALSRPQSAEYTSAQAGSIIMILSSGEASSQRQKRELRKTGRA